MGRPGLYLGTSGTVRVYETPSGYRAMTRVRDYDGRVHQVERYGRTQGAARAALALALRDRVRIEAEAEIGPDTKFGVVAEAWFSDFERQDRSPTTLATYRDRLDKQILPALGNIRVRELTVGIVDRHLRAVGTKHGAAMAKQTKTVLSQVIGLAVRHDALTQNPVRETSPISTKPKNPPRALTAPQAVQLMAALTYDGQAVARDLPALVATMLASGLRLGEACAMLWHSVDFQAGTLEVEATVVRLRGEGLLRKSTKSTAGRRTLRLPKWCVDMLRERAAVSSAAADAPVFAAPKGNLRDPSNTAADLRDAFENAGSAGRPVTCFARPPRACSTRAASPLGRSPTSVATLDRRSQWTGTWRVIHAAR
jgi:integrase